MSYVFSIRPLVHDQVLPAFALISLFDPDLDLAKWVKYAEDIIDENDNGAEQGIIAVQNDLRCIYGIAVFRPKPDLRKGRTLETENFAVVDISASRIVAKLLLRGLEEAGQKLSCNCITISLLQPLMRRWLREPGNPAIELFRAAGFRGEQMRLRKCFSA